MRLGGELLEEVDSFKYLGPNVSSNGGGGNGEGCGTESE